MSITRATPLSDKQYYPMLLTNGRDSMLVDYTGSCYTGRSGHSHLEQHQGVPCGWYKTGQRTQKDIGIIQSLFAVGIQVYMFGAPAEPRWYEQEFSPDNATLVTELTFANDVQMKVMSFIDNNSLWCQKLEVLACPKDRELSIGFSISAPFAGCNALRLPKDCTFSASYSENGLHSFLYEVAELKGAGFMLCSPGEGAQQETLYSGVSAGFSACRIVTAADLSEYDQPGDVLEQRLLRAHQGFEKLHVAHKAEWNEFFNSMRVTLPDPQMQYLFDLSRYVVRAAQHPDNGMIGLGNIPCLWGGGLYCCADAWYAHQAMLRCADYEGGLRFVKTYVDHSEYGTECLRKIGFPGTAFAGWDDCKGQFKRDDFSRYVTVYKPSFSAYAIIAIYWQEMYAPGSLTDEMKQVIEQVVTFLRAVTIQEDNNGVRLKPMEAGTEGGFMVEVDTFHQLLIGRAMEDAGLLLKNAKWREIGSALVQGVNINMTEDGVLLPFKNAPYTGGTQFIFALLLMPGKLDIRSIDGTRPNR